MRIESEKKLIGACGLYCRLCPEYEDFRMGFAESAERLRCLITEMISVNAWPWDVNDPNSKFFNFDEFMKGLKWLSSQKALCKGCGCDVVSSTSKLLPGQNPDCKIKKCCFERGFRFCYECPDFACGKLIKLEEHYPSCLRNLKRMKDAGIERWLEEQRAKVRAGLTNRK
ncbi:DUF3795 domain-containing protein [Candidatus Bathyarchaeota archaeon]|nr:DUF3795 domain-containing protein [Candidatus Bathyarchaeota archaeon]